MERSLNGTISLLGNKIHGIDLLIKNLPISEIIDMNGLTPLYVNK